MKISDDVYVLDSSKGSYVYVITGIENVLIDTGLPWKGKSIIKELQSIGIELQNIKHILLTHHDIDHIGNALMLQQLTGAEIWASKEDIPYITGEINRYGFKKYFKYIFKVKSPQNVKSFIPGQSINEIEIVTTPGHTPGHVCLLYKDILFAGDLVENKKGKLRPYPSLWNWNNSIMMESIKKISNLNFKWICPAHGIPMECHQFY